MSGLVSDTCTMSQVTRVCVCERKKEKMHEMHGFAWGEVLGRDKEQEGIKQWLNSGV